MNYDTTYTGNNYSQRSWLALVVIILLLSPLIGYVTERFWDVKGMTTVGRVIVFISFFSVLFSNKQLKVSAYFLLASLYYLATLIIPITSGLKPRLTLSYDLLLCFFFFIMSNSSINAKIQVKTIKGMIYLIIISLIVSLIQEFYNPFFLVSNTVQEAFSGMVIDKAQFRLQSIWSFVNLTAGGYTIMAFYSLILGDMLEKKKSIRQIAFLCAIVLLYCILSRQRWILAVYLIISSQMYRLFNKATNQITVIVVILLCIGILYYSGFPLFEVIQNRYLDVEAGGLTQGSFKARTQSWNAFKNYLSSSFLLGIRVSGQVEAYFQALGRSSGQNLLGTIYPLITYGIIGSIWFYMLLLVLLRRSYWVGRSTKNFSCFVLFVAIIVAGFSNNFTLADPGTMVAFIFLQYYEDKIAMQKKQQELLVKV